MASHLRCQKSLRDRDLADRFGSLACFAVTVLALGRGTVRRDWVAEVVDNADKSLMGVQGVGIVRFNFANIRTNGIWNAI